MFDSDEFIEIFLSEANEIVEGLENDLVILEDNKTDNELLNKIFRSAHTLKSSAGTVGFDSMSDINHVAENLLEKVRSGILGVTPQMITVLLEFLDKIKEMLSNIKEGKNETDGVEGIESLKSKIRNIADGKEFSENADKKVTAKKDVKTSSGEKLFSISMEFKNSIFNNGIDPLMFISDLEKIGKIKKITVHKENIPPISKMTDPYICYASFDLVLETSYSIDEINNIFLFVIDDNDILVKEIAESEEEDPTTAAAYEGDTEKEESDGDDEKEENISSLNDKIKTSNEAVTVKQSSQQAPQKQIVASTVRVDTRKLDTMMNLVGELVIAQSRIMQLTSKLEGGGNELKEAVTSIDGITREIQEEVMNIRMMPIGPIFTQFHRYVRDLSIELGKDIKIIIKGETTEIDKNMLEQLSDPLKHIIRNSIDHGIESKEERLKKGKPEYGTITLSAAHQEGHVVIEISDDGNGLNKDKILAKAIDRGIFSKDAVYPDADIYRAIFLPGFSTADVVSDISGRGVGMDVVRVNIEKMKGRIEIKTEAGKGTTMIIKLPLTLAIIEGITFSLGRHIYVMPLLSIVEQLKVDAFKIKPFEGKGEMVNIRGEYMPLIRLHRIFGVETSVTEIEDGIVVVAEAGYKKCAVFVDELLDQQQAVIKALDSSFKKHPGIAGGTILGDGRIALIIDMQGLFNETLRGSISSSAKDA